MQLIRETKKLPPHIRRHARQGLRLSHENPPGGYASAEMTTAAFLLKALVSIPQHLGARRHPPGARGRPQRPPAKRPGRADGVQWVRLPLGVESPPTCRPVSCWCMAEGTAMVAQVLGPRRSQGILAPGLLSPTVSACPAGSAWDPPHPPGSSQPLQQDQQEAEALRAGSAGPLCPSQGIRVRSTHFTHTH